jgi:wyosine [tRNA(Phe)-imidazoG37] synthetase (radical SAM superfamily)
MLPLFGDHSRHWRTNRYVYPVVSRRSRGLSIGVNLNPDGVCNFDCSYCCVDRTTAPTVTEVDLSVLRAELAALLPLAKDGRIWQSPPFDQTPESLRRINDVAFSGDGEPTSYPRFAEACQLVADVLAWHEVPARIVVITNATLLHRDPVEEGLRILDAHQGEVWAKLDAGTEAYYHLVDRSKIPFQRILDNLLRCGQRRPLTIQTLFARIDGQAPPASEVAAWVARLVALRDAGADLRLIQLYTVARPTTEATVTALTQAELDAIAAPVRAAGLPIAIFPGNA